MLSLEPSGLERAVLDALDRVCALPGAGHTLSDEGWVIDAPLWKAAMSLVPVSIKAGDDDLGFITLALIADRLGAELKLLPALDHFVATRLLERASEKDAANLAHRALAGEIIVGLAIELDQLDRSAAPVALGGAICDAAVSIGRDGRIFAGAVAAREPAERNLADLPLASFGRLALELTSTPSLLSIAISERRTLVAAAIGGMVRAAVQLAVDYAKERVQFGQPIGSFQSIAHGLADGNVAAESIQILALKAAWSQEGDPARFELLSRMAYAHAAEAGSVAVAFAMHVFGGYGNTPEYPVQAYFRSVRAFMLAVGQVRPEVRKLGRAVLAERRIRELGAVGPATAGGL